MAYPTGTDLSDHLIAAGVIFAAPADLTLFNSYMTMAWKQWEKDSGWHPFLAGQSEQRTFDAPDGYMLFPNVGILSLSDLKIDDDSQTFDTEYFLQHQIPDGPYMAVQFASGLNPYLRTVKLTGVFGYQEELGADVNLALLDRGAEIYQGVLSGGSGEVAEVKQGPVTIKYATNSSGDSTSGFGGFYSQVLEMYRRKV